MSRRDSEARVAGQGPVGRKLWGESVLGQVLG